MESLDLETQIKEILTNFFTLKFRYQGVSLIKAIDAFQWGVVGSLTPDQFLLVLEEFQDISKDKNNQAVSITLPLNSDGTLDISLAWLKGSACFPWELDPVKDKLWVKICKQKHILIQLAQASHYGCPKASEELRDISMQYFNLRKKHPFRRDKNYSAYRTFRFPIGPANIFENLEAEYFELSEMKEEEFTKIFDDLLQVEKEGLSEIEKPKLSRLISKDDDLESLIQPKENPKKNTLFYKAPSKETVKKNGPQGTERVYRIYICGEHYNNKTILGWIKNNLVRDYDADDASHTIAHYRLERELFRLELTGKENIPRDVNSLDGVIIVGPQTDPEAKADELKRVVKAKSFLFIGTPQPNPSRAKSTNWYLREEYVDSDYADEIFEDFISDMIFYSQD